MGKWVSYERIKKNILYTMKVLRQKSFVVFAVFTWFRKTALHESSRWRCSNMDLRESMWDSAKVFREGLHVQFAAKLFCLETFMVYSITVRNWSL